MIFSVVFTNSQSDEFQLDFSTYDTNIADRWAVALTTQCSADNMITERDRMYNFPDGKWDEPKIVDELNKCIDIINQHGMVIHHRAAVGMPQEQLNHLHHYFENLRGGVLAPAQTWFQADDDTRAALERYNVIIHRAESFYRGRQYAKSYPRMVSRFAFSPRYDLIDSDYPLFTLERTFGEVYINYCEVGKPLYDVFNDDDDIVGEDNIRPLRYYSAGFTTYFCECSAVGVGMRLAQMNEWWDRNHNYLGDLGFTKGDPKNAIGNIPVAILIDNGMTQEEIIDKLCEFNSMDRVEIGQ
jgi:hypothetical protein